MELWKLCLSVREWVLEMYFGINRDSAMTLNEIGEEFDLTRERVRQIKEKAIQRLRHRSRSKNLVDIWLTKPTYTILKGSSRSLFRLFCDLHYIFKKYCNWLPFDLK